MLKRSDERTLVLIDEIIVGTNPRQGAALAQAILEEMVRTGSRIIVSTHYSELKELASAESAFRNRLGIIRPGHPAAHLPASSWDFPASATPWRSPAITACPKMFFSAPCELIDSRDLSVEAMLEETQRFRQEMEEERTRLRAGEEENSRKKALLEEQERRIKAQLQEIREGRGMDFLAELEEHRKEVARHIHSLQTADLREAGDIQA